MNNQIKGLLITALGVLLVVPDSLFVRLIDAEPMVITFWRSIVSSAFILTVVLGTQGIGGFKSVFQTGRVGLLYAICIGSTAPGFVLAVTNTSVANVVLIFASIPLFASVFSFIFLGEIIQRRILITSAFVIFGLSIIAYGSGFSEIASWKGDLWALYVSIVYAAGLTALRRLKDISMVPAVSIAYFASAVLVGLFCSPFETFVINWPLFIGHGIFIGSATCLLTLGPRYISSAEVALLILLESVLAPILVWVIVGEYPGEWTLVGGGVVLLTLIISNLILLKNEKSG